MENVIRHEGIIDYIKGTHVRVRITQTPACAGCKVAARCATAEAREKVIDATATDASAWHVGQTVVVTTAGTMAGRALLLGFGLPLLLMLLVLVVAMATGCSEGTTALLMLASLVPYYFVLWLCRDRIASKMTFHVERKEE